MRRCGCVLAAIALVGAASFGVHAQDVRQAPVPLYGMAGGRLVVGGQSMRPNVWRGDYIAGYEWSGRPDETLRGRIILFVRPRPAAADWISRVVGLPGERIRLEAGEVYIDRRRVARERIEDIVVPEPDGRPPARAWQYVETLPNAYRYRIMQFTTSAALSNTQEYTVPADHVFVLSDNRDNALDSRVAAMGPVPAANVRGVVTEVSFSFDQDVSLVERAALAVFVANPPAWYPPRDAEQWRQAAEWRESRPWARHLRLERSQLRVDQF